MFSSHSLIGPESFFVNELNRSNNAQQVQFKKKYLTAVKINKMANFTRQKKALVAR